MLFNRLQLFIFCLLIVTFIYHILPHHHFHTVPPPKLPSVTYFQPIYFPVLPVYTIPLKTSLQINESKAYRSYQRKLARNARRKHNYSTYH